MSDAESQRIEIDLLMQAIARKYGYDFRNYAKASVKRRIMNVLSSSGLNTISEMQHKLLYDKEFFETMLLNLSVNVTEMYRDPSFYSTLRKEIIPQLRSRPFIKIWHAGCATGEEVYSMAILLKEENLYEKSWIYATDFNEQVLKKAREGIYPIDMLKKYSSNYLNAGGAASLADYYTARYDFVIMENALKRNIVFSDHNLVTDGVFAEMDLILCRNVLIYFDTKLQNHVFKLFRDSLSDEGFLCLGSKETVKFSEYSDDFEDVVSGEKIYRKL